MNEWIPEIVSLLLETIMDPGSGWKEIMLVKTMPIS